MLASAEGTVIQKAIVKMYMDSIVRDDWSDQWFERWIGRVRGVAQQNVLKERVVGDCDKTRGLPLTPLYRRCFLHT